MDAEVIKMNKELDSQKKVNKLIRKKWFLPAMYLTSVAMVMIGAFWYQSVGQDVDESKQSAEVQLPNEKPAIPVNEAVENFAMPLMDSKNVVVKGQFYDINAEESEQEAALVKYGDTYQPNTGIDYGLKDNASFDVLAAMSGTVIRVQTDSLLGNMIEIEHEPGLVSRYSSISNPTVSVGDKVKQQEIIAKAGRSAINPDANVHVHFEIRKDGVAVNPALFLKKPLSALKSYDISKEQEATTNESNQSQREDEEETNSSTNQQTPSESNRPGSNTNQDQNSSSE